MSKHSKLMRKAIDALFARNPWYFKLKEEKGREKRNKGELKRAKGNPKA